MKETYVEPLLEQREQLQEITAAAEPIFSGEIDTGTAVPKEGKMKEMYVEPVLEREESLQEVTAGVETVVSGDLEPTGEGGQREKEKAGEKPT